MLNISIFSLQNNYIFRKENFNIMTNTSIYSDIDINVKEYLLSKYPSYHGYVDMDSFADDYRIIRSVKMMMTKPTMNYRLFINNIIRLHNAFSNDFIKMIPFIFKDESHLIKINTAIHLLNYNSNKLPIDENFLYTLKHELKIYDNDY